MKKSFEQKVSEAEWQLITDILIAATDIRMSSRFWTNQSIVGIPHKVYRLKETV